MAWNRLAKKLVDRLYETNYHTVAVILHSRKEGGKWRRRTGPAGHDVGLAMKIWFNKVNESRRSMVEVAEPLVTIGRDPSNTVCLQSPLVSRQHAVVRLVRRQAAAGEHRPEQLPGGRGRGAGRPDGGLRARAPRSASGPSASPSRPRRRRPSPAPNLEAHLRSIMADLELRIHRKLLERLDLYEFEANRGSDPQSILLLENNIEDVCREMGVFGADNEPLLEEITGLTLRDHLVNQLIMETGGEEYFDLAALTTNEFDVPATLVPEREAELHGLLQFVRERLNLAECRDMSQQVTRVEGRFNDIFHLVRPHLHQRAAQVPHPADAEKGPQGHDFRLRARCKTCSAPPRSRKSWSSAWTRSTSSAAG